MNRFHGIDIDSHRGREGFPPFPGRPDGHAEVREEPFLPHEFVESEVSSSLRHSFKARFVIFKSAEGWCGLRAGFLISLERVENFLSLRKSAI